MYRDTYSVRTPWGDVMRFSARLAEARAPIRYLDGEEEISTQWQTADARHSATSAAMLVCVDDEDIDRVAEDEGFSADEARSWIRDRLLVTVD